MRKRIGNKGSAIEIVIIAFIVCFAMSTLLTLYITRMSTYNYFIKNNQETRIFFDQVGEEFVSLITNNDGKDTFENIESLEILNGLSDADNDKIYTTDCILSLRRKEINYRVTINKINKTIVINRLEIDENNLENIIVKEECFKASMDGSNNIITWIHCN